MYADDGIQEQLDESTAGPPDGPADDHYETLAEVPPIPSEDDDEDEETSLEALIARRAAVLDDRDEEDEDDPDELVQLAPQRALRSVDPLPTKVVPIRTRREFVCNRCHLVKARSQLADYDRKLCRDCV